MAKSDPFMQQHKDLVALVTSVAGQLDATKLSAAPAAAAVHSQLSTMAGKLKVHLGMEDTVLYPAMLANPATKATAEKFKSEMGGIKTVFDGYLKKYPTPAAISANAAGFVADTKGLFDALGKRVQRENTELYPAFDRS